MDDYLLREYRQEDIPCLVELWHRVFGDPPELIEDFLRRLPGFGTGAVAEFQGRAVGCAYALDGMYLLDKGSKRRCCYIYAVAVSPEHRHRGLGESLSIKARDLSRQRGSLVTCTLPAEQSLYPWYEKILGLSCALYRRSYSAPAAALLPCRELQAEEYFLLREKLLEGRPHMSPNRELTDFASLFYRTFGGGLYLCGGALCAAYGQDEVVIKELIAPGHVSPEAVASSLAACLGRKKALYYLPSLEGESYISAPPGSLSPELIWNLSFE